MTNGKSPNPKRLADVAETDAIRRLLSGVMRRDRKAAPAPIPPPKPEPLDTHASAIAFVADNVGEIVTPAAPPPLPEKVTTTVPAPAAAFEESFTPSREIESAPHEPAPIFPPPLAETEAEPVSMPIGALSFGEFLQRINWRNRPEDLKSLPLIGVPVPTGYADTVEGVLTAINWDDE
jgi:hypothetical protein